MLFLWLKALHIIFVVCWFSCLFYLPRLFVNYAMANEQSTRDQLLVMQQKLFRFSIPFALLTVGLGVWLVSLNSTYYMAAGWFHLKMFLIVLLVIYHIACGQMIKGFAAGRAHRSHQFYRWFNELPVFILFAAIILAVVKPF